jgi:hypothetical protein
MQRVAFILATFLSVTTVRAQNRNAPGESIGTITTQGDLIVFTLDEDALGKTNLFDLTKRTLRFRPDHGA